MYGRFARFDTRSLAVLLSTASAFPLPVIGFLAPHFIIPGGMKYLIVIWLFTAASFAVTVYAGRLTDHQFTILGAGGLLGIAGSAYVVSDPAATRAVVALLAAIPAIAALASTKRVVVAFTLTALAFAVTLSILDATSITAILVAGGAAITTVVVPVLMVTALRTSLGTALSKVALLSNTDPLTGLLNRRGFLTRASELLDQCAANSNCVGLIMIDIDHFKTVNDDCGHAVGDSVLTATSTVVTTGSPAESLISRFGGEEFVILTAIATPADLNILCHTLRREIAAHCAVTVSIGAVFTPVQRGAAPSTTPSKC